MLNRSLFLGGRYPEAFEELVAAREAAGETHLKTILGVGELDQVPLHETLEEGWMSPERFASGLVVAERRTDADPQGTDRLLLGSGLLNDRLTCDAERARGASPRPFGGATAVRKPLYALVCNRDM